MKNTVTALHIADLLKRSEVVVCTQFGKVTIVTVRLPNGFVLVESAGAVDPANYSEAIGREICMKRIESKLWELEGYVLSSQLAERFVCGAVTPADTACALRVMQHRGKGASRHAAQHIADYRVGIAAELAAQSKAPGDDAIAS